MKKTGRLILVLFLFTLILWPATAAPAVFATETKTITILFTHDMHDHILSTKDIRNGEIYYSGGFARLATAISAEKEAAPEALLLDAGDFSMGTPFQTLFTSDAPELRLLGKLGYDATTFGNHEYDYRPEGLAGSLTTALNSGGKLPYIVQSNVAFPDTASAGELKRAYLEYGFRDYLVLTRNGIKIGIFGLMGKNSASDAPMSGVVFKDPVESAKRVVRILKEQENADLIICLSHSGTWAKKSESEDEILAKQVPEINVIVSGHTHTTLSEPIITGDTIIGSAGDSCRNLGVMNISREAGGGWKLVNYRLQQIDERLPDDQDVLGAIHSFENLLQEKYFDRFGLEHNDVLAVSPYNFNSVDYMYDHLQEDPLGNLISDAYV